MLVAAAKKLGGPLRGGCHGLISEHREKANMWNLPEGSEGHQEGSTHEEMTLMALFPKLFTIKRRTILNFVLMS